MVKDYPQNRGQAGGNSKPTPNPQGAAAAEPPKRNRLYALNGREEQEKSADMVTVLPEGVEVDLRKIEAVKNLPKPLTPSDILSLLGLDGYYRRFVEGFSSIASPLTDLIKKKAKFERTETCKKSFPELKDKHSSAPMLSA
ncbi:uncharacterized protein LOC114076142 [Solanum pennellii]|uniref:Uncharacterized protein LOC114076142 n=1 Tax=Solanum pennellii TaxID=28526 RepID=A0ABM1V4L9_SOLPN|nr:uncharacterized protein LOC114076142 [Solanum pennellii]